MRAHLKSTDLHPITIVCSFCRKASAVRRPLVDLRDCGETSSNITIITHRRVETKSYLAIIVLITLSMHSSARSLVHRPLDSSNASYLSMTHSDFRVCSKFEVGRDGSHQLWENSWVRCDESHQFWLTVLLSHRQ